MDEKILTDAKRINDITGWPMAECENKAQQIDLLCKEMKKRIVEFYFKKKDGTTRQAFGTLQDEVILPLIKDASNREPRPDVVTYFDKAAQQFRSFRKENFISFVS